MEGAQVPAPTGAPPVAPTPPVVEAPPVEPDLEEEMLDVFDPATKSPTLQALDQLAAMEREKNPAFKGFSVKAREAAIERMDPEQRALLHNVRSVGQRAMDTWRTEEARLRTQQQEIEQERAAIATERTKLMALLTEPLTAEEQNEQEPDKAADPMAWLEWSIGKKAEARAQAKIEAFQKQIGERGNAREQELLLAQQKIAHEQRVATLTAWADSHPELADDKVFDAVEAKLKAAGYNDAILTPDEALNLVLMGMGRPPAGVRSRTAETAALIRRPSASAVVVAAPDIGLDISTDARLRYVQEHPEVSADQFIEVIKRAKAAGAKGD